MTTRTSTRIAGLATALLASLVVAPTALAIPAAFSVANGKLVLQSDPAPSQPVVVPDRVDKIGILTHGTTGIPDRVDRLGTIAGRNTGAQSVPDRVDGLGSVRGPQIVPTPDRVSNGGSTLNWSYAAIGAALLMAAALLAVFTASVTGRRRGGGIPQS